MNAKTSLPPEVISDLSAKLRTTLPLLREQICALSVDEQLIVLLSTYLMTAGEHGLLERVAPILIESGQMLQSAVSEMKALFPPLAAGAPLRNWPHAMPHTVQ